MMQYSFVIEIEGSVVRVIAPVFAPDEMDARRQASEWLDLFPAWATLAIVENETSVAILSR